MPAACLLSANNVCQPYKSRFCQPRRCCQSLCISSSLLLAELAVRWMQGARWFVQDGKSGYKYLSHCATHRTVLCKDSALRSVYMLVHI